MKRRRFFQTAALAIPAGSALLAQEPAAPPTPQTQPPPGASGSGMEYPKIDSTYAELASAPVVRFFSPVQFSALKKLSDLLMPRHGETPGAIDAEAPEFLDFLIGESPAERQKIYVDGLDALNKHSMAQFKKPFAELDDASAAAVIEPGIKTPWNYDAPADPLAHLLQVARADIRAATMNSRAYATAAANAPDSGRGGRRQGGVGQYWYPLT